MNPEVNSGSNNYNNNNTFRVGLNNCSPKQQTTYTQTDIHPYMFQQESHKHSYVIKTQTNFFELSECQFFLYKKSNTFGNNYGRKFLCFVFFCVPPIG